ncbi:hypothetical protein BGZ95_003946, partial [Linnemannia exigua]
MTNDAFCNSEWPEAASARGDKILTLHDLMDRTPKEQISKGVKTLNDCRTVPIGDACHK